MRKIRIISGIIISTLGILGAGYLLYVNGFFENRNSQTFNEVITPVVTIFAALIYLYTLLEIKKQSQITNNNFQFDFFKEKIEKERIKLENWRFNLRPIGELERFSDLLKETNGIKYYKLYNSIYKEVINSKEYLSDLEKGVVINQLDKREYVGLIYTLFSMNFELHLNNSSIEKLLKEINQSELSEFQKKSLNELIIPGILNDYMLIFYDYQRPIRSGMKIQGKWVEFAYNEVLYKADMASPDSIADEELKLTSSLKNVKFDRLSNYIYKNKIWE
jgi:hypothetical protein